MHIVVSKDSKLRTSLLLAPAFFQNPSTWHSDHRRQDDSRRNPSSDRRGLHYLCPSICCIDAPDFQAELCWLNTQAPVLNASHNLRPFLPAKELPSTSCVFGIFGGGLMFVSLWNHLLPEGIGATLCDVSGLPTLRLRMSRARSSNSIFQKCASIKTSHHTQSPWSSGV